MRPGPLSELRVVRSPAFFFCALTKLVPILVPLQLAQHAETYQFGKLKIDLTYCF